MCTAVLIGGEPASHPSAFGLIYEALLVSQDIFVTPWSSLMGWGWSFSAYPNLLVALKTLHYLVQLLAVSN
jgi:hypothetical protein